jgi:hypothetical protein
MQIATLREPSASFDQFPMQQGDLSGWSAKAHPAELKPETEGFRQA